MSIPQVSPWSSPFFDGTLQTAYISFRKYLSENIYDNLLSVLSFRNDSVDKL